MKNNAVKYIVVGLVIYLVSATGSYAFFSYGKEEGSKQVGQIGTTDKMIDGPGFKIDPDAPKTEECPINGVMRTKVEKEWWEKHRPLGVMIENHEEARPQSGLSKADVIYEAVAEGGITRFLGIYYCQDTKMLGPVRSARVYFIDLVSGYGDQPLYVHVGGANTPGPADALGMLSDLGWTGENDLNQFSIGFPTFWRDYERLPDVATEHTMYSATSKLWQVGKERGFTNENPKGKEWDNSFEPWKFKDDAGKGDRPESFIAGFNFWDGYKEYAVMWTYSPSDNSYKRSNGGKAHQDKNEGEQLAVKNVAFAFMSEKNVNDGYENNVHLAYGTTGSGKGVVLQDGKKIEGTWQKVKRTDMLRFFDLKGDEIEFNRGQTWVEIVPVGTEIDYK